MKKLHTLFIGYFLIAPFMLLSQIVQIPTNTTNDLIEIKVTEGMALINGRYKFLAKCYANCDSIELLSSPATTTHSCHELNVIDSNQFFVSCDDSVFDRIKVRQTLDGGQNWSTLYDSVNFSLNELLFFDEVEAVGYGISRKAVRTLDSAKTWVNESQPFFAVTAAENFGDSTICIGTVQRFCISRDRGRTWDFNGFVQASPVDFFFLNADTIMAASYINPGNYFSFTYNGGKNWQDYPITVDPSAIYFLSKDEGYMVGDIFPMDRGLILRTLDGGKTWETFNTGIRTVLRDIQFINDSVALLCGSNGVLLKFNKNLFYENVSIAEESLSEGSWSLFPNPTSTLQQIKLFKKTPQPLQIDLYNMAGQKVMEVYRGLSVQGQQEFNVNLNNLASGIYVYQIQIESEVIHFKTIKR